MGKQCRSQVGVIEGLKENDIVLGLGVFKMKWNEGLRASVYKGVEVQEVKGIAFYTKHLLQEYKSFPLQTFHT